MKFLYLLAALLLSVCAYANNPINPIVEGKISFSEHPKKLGTAGRVIAHENGTFDFFPLSICYGMDTCPKQLVKIRESNISKSPSQQLHFVKVSIRSLKDGSWVVAHNQVKYIIDKKDSSCSLTSLLGKGVEVQYQIPADQKLVTVKRPNDTVEHILVDSTTLQNILELNQDKHIPITTVEELPDDMSIIEVDLSQIDSLKYEELKAKYKEKFNAYRLKDYVDQDKDIYFNYFLYFKTDPNIKIIEDIRALNLQNRAVLESRTNNDAEWVFQLEGGAKGGIHFTGRVSNDKALDELLKEAPKYGHLMWAIEIQSSASEATIKSLTSRIKKTPYVSELDAMPFESFEDKEFFATGCYKTLVDLGADISMTDSPLKCLKMFSKS